MIAGKCARSCSALARCTSRSAAQSSRVAVLTAALDAAEAPPRLDPPRDLEGAVVFTLCTENSSSACASSAAAAAALDAYRAPTRASLVCTLLRSRSRAKTHGLPLSSTYFMCARTFSCMYFGSRSRTAGNDTSWPFSMPPFTPTHVPDDDDEEGSADSPAAAPRSLGAPGAPGPAPPAPARRFEPRMGSAASAISGASVSLAAARGSTACPSGSSGPTFPPSEPQPEDAGSGSRPNTLNTR